VPAAVEVEWPAHGPGELVVEIVGRTAGVERRVQELVEILAGATVDDVEPATWTSYPWSSGQTGLKLTCVLSGLRDVLTVARETGAHVRGSSGAGVLYAALPDADAVPGAVARLREVCARHEGTVVVVDAPPEVKQAVDVWGPVPALDLMRRVKDQFDPDHRLSPGRFVGGI
jgi:glycolate oxidase FAD binding subunit